MRVTSNEGPRGGPRHARDARRDRAGLRPGHGRAGHPPHLCIGYACPEAADRGHTALLQDGDRIAIDAHARTITVALDDAALSRRPAAWQPRRTERLAGAQEKYARLAGPPNPGAVTHASTIDWPLE
jgi:dihydroxy-acid dehydratase